VGRIYAGQTSLRLVLKTYVDLTGIQSATIRFLKPDGTPGEFDAGAPNPEEGLVCHEFGEGELDAAGWWRFWAFVRFADGRTAAGEAAKVHVWREGS